MQQPGVAAFSVSAVPCLGESQPQVGLLVMPARVTVLMAVSHPTRSPRAGLEGEVPSPGSLVGWLASREAPTQHSRPPQSWDQVIVAPTGARER